MGKRIILPTDSGTDREVANFSRSARENGGQESSCPPYEYRHQLGIAHHEKFCNRRQEIETLKKNMLAGIHTVVHAPRRYGKSSLARVVGGEG